MSTYAQGALFAGASLAAPAALTEPGASWAACASSTQTISTGVTGPVLANGGSILVTGAGSIAGGAEGVFAENSSITTLTNKGSIGAAIGVPGGIGVLTNSGQTIGLLINANNATISGGAGASTLGVSGGAGGTGVANSGTITTLGNRGTISGGNGGASGLPPAPAARAYRTQRERQSPRSPTAARSSAAPEALPIR